MERLHFESKAIHTIDAAWPRGASVVRYQQHGLAGIKILKVSATEDGRGSKVDIVESTAQESLHYFGSVFCLTVITQSWRPGGTSHEKLRHFESSMKNFTEVVESRGLTSFFGKTRLDMAGIFGLPQSYHENSDNHDEEYFALVYDVVLGFWTKYDPKCKQWQGFCIVMEEGLSLKAIAEELLEFSHTKMFLHLLVANYTVGFLSHRSGELSKQLREIELHSGHHDSILRPVPATYGKLEKLSADATAKANLASYYTGVTSQLANELLQHLEKTCNEDSSLAKNATSHVRDLKQRLKTLTKFLAYLEGRAERQVTAILHLVNQANASTSLVVAHDTKILAMASKRDASSMKVLAAVTTVFLPGAFVATLFSMNMFDWFAGDSNPVVSGRLWIYWTISIPLTIITVGIWVGFDFWAKKKDEEHQNYQFDR